jgi:hypothetical protein
LCEEIEERERERGFLEREKEFQKRERQGWDRIEE